MNEKQMIEYLADNLAWAIIVGGDNILDSLDENVMRVLEEVKNKKELEDA